MNREWKGNMQRRFDRRLWSLILSLLLLGGSMAAPTYVRADFAPGEPGTPPPPEGGDPDWPDNKPTGKSVKVGPPRGVSSPVAGGITPRTHWVTWVKWTIRVAYGSTWRVFFRV